MAKTRDKPHKSPPQGDKYRDEISRLNLLDDEYMKKFFEMDGTQNGCACAQFMLRLITGIKDLKIIRLSQQPELFSPGGHNVRLDVLATDSKDHKYDMELQRAGSLKELLLRGEFYLSTLITRALNKGESYTELRDCFVIFITEHDLLGKGLPLYHIVPKIEETGETVDLRWHLIIVNAAYKGNDDLGALMHDICSTQVTEMHDTPLKEIAGKLKEPGGTGDETMSGVFEEFGKKCRAEGKAEGRAEGRVEGRAEGRAEAKAEQQHKTVGMIKTVMQANNWTAEKTLEFFHFSKEDCKSLMPLICAQA